jgi:hypothetical protein
VDVQKQQAVDGSTSHWRLELPPPHTGCVSLFLARGDDLNAVADGSSVLVIKPLAHVMFRVFGKSVLVNTTPLQLQVLDENGVGAVVGRMRVSGQCAAVFVLYLDVGGGVAMMLLALRLLAAVSNCG